MHVVTPSHSPSQRVSLVRKYENLVETPDCPCSGCIATRKKKFDDKWEVFAKKCPGVQIFYGTLRCYSKWYDGDDEEAWKSVAVAIGGVAEVIFFTNFGLYGLWGPLGYVICSSLPGNVIGGGLETAVKYSYWKPSEEGEHFPLEETVYENMIRDIPFVGGAYSAATAGVALAQGDKETAKVRGKNVAVNLVVSTAAYVVAKCVSNGSGIDNSSSNCECPPSSSSSPPSTSSPTLFVDSNSVPANREPEKIVTSNVVLQVVNKEQDVIVDNVDSGLVDMTYDPAVGAKFTFSSFIANSAKKVAPNVTQAILVPELTFGVNWQMQQGPPVRRELVAALLYRNCPSALAIIGDQETKYEYITRCILHSLFGLDNKDNEDPLDEMDIKQLAHQLLKTGEPQIVQAVLLSLPFGAAVSAPFTDEDEVAKIEGEKRRVLTLYLVQKMHPGAKDVQFPEIFKNDKEFKQFECPKGEIKYQPSREKNGQIKVKGPSGLCLDGGGICGLNSLEILDLFESQLIKKGQSSPMLDRIFDYYVGTSVGAIISVALLVGKSIKEIKKLMFKLKDQIFSGTKPHDSKKLESIFKEYFGPNLTMSEVGREQGVRLVIPVTRTDVTPFELNFYTNDDGDSRNSEKVWKVLLRATAAPSYFPCPEEPAGHPQHLDGGLVANNATRAFVAYLRSERKSPGFILSIGTGKFNRRTTTRFPSIRGRVTADAPNVKRIITDFALQMTEADGPVVEDHADFCLHSGCSYYRLTPTLSENIELNETCDLKLLKMLYQTKAYVYGNERNIQKMVKDLVEFNGLRRTTGAPNLSSTFSSLNHAHNDSDEEEIVPQTLLRHRRMAGN